MAPTDAKRAIVDDALIEELALALRTNDSFDHSAWFDVVEHRVLTLPFEVGEDDIAAPTDGDPNWMQEDHALATRIIADPERYRRVPAVGTLGRLTDFIRSVREPALQRVLWDAERGGRGAFRRVRNALARRGLEQMWHDFEDEADRRLALDWLRSEGLLNAETRPQ